LPAGAIESATTVSSTSIQLTTMSVATTGPTVASTTTVSLASPVYYKVPYVAGAGVTVVAAQIVSAKLLKSTTTFTLISSAAWANPWSSTLKAGSWIQLAENRGDVWMWLDTKPLGKGTYRMDMMIRWYIQTVGRKRGPGNVGYFDTTILQDFVVQNATLSSSRSSHVTTSARRTSTQRISRTTSPSARTSKTSRTTIKTTRITSQTRLPHNVVLAETCKAGGHYKNPQNCCCAPPITRRVTATVRATRMLLERDVTEFIANKQDIRARQVVGQHLCKICPSKALSKVYCCLPKATKTIVVKTVSVS
jgi:hypothetical protein